MTLQTRPARRKLSLRQLQPTVQVLIMLAFTLALVSIIALGGYLLPEVMTGAAAGR